ncbi:hypothetical protein [Demequina litorisediminis]|uniref:hypothetical protein n=1 Tax=Demequina litorisediminis TaxID=1849022 RepID=UPI0024E10156|nr:hypothetical protein [Demequina litorisediminis]
MQHGVTKDDLSRWLNSKDIALCITTTPAEHASIVGDGTSYKATSRETALTGQPRHDRLVRLAKAPGERQPTILVMPTWRRELMGKNVDGGNLREPVRGVLVERVLHPVECPARVGKPRDDRSGRGCRDRGATPPEP